MDRREFLKSLAAFAAFGAVAHVAGRPLSAFAAESAAKPLRARAKSVIEIWVWGGPCQLETFDPKPNAPRDYNGGYKAIPTNVPGIQISEFFPLLAQHADKYSIIRTMTHQFPGHETATYLMQTGREPGGGRVYPEAVSRWSTRSSWMSSRAWAYRSRGCFARQRATIRCKPAGRLGR